MVLEIFLVVTLYLSNRKFLMGKFTRKTCFICSFNRVN